MDLSINIEDFYKMCRLCLQLTEILMPLSLHNIINMVKACASIDISENDELPNHICLTCLTRLQDSFNFKQFCQKSDYNLKRAIAAYKNNEQNENLIEKSDEKSSLLKNEVFSINDELNECNLERLSIKSEDLPVGDEIENNYNNETFSLKNEEFRSDDEVKNDNNDDNVQEEKRSFPENTKNNKKKKAKKGTKRKKRFICESCDRKFETPRSLGWHCNRTHKAKGTKCSYCTIICYHPVQLTVHEESHTTSITKCEHCGKQFANKTLLTSHMYTHTTDRPFKCPQCDSSFKTKYSLNSHMKTKHALEKKPAKLSSCHICGKTVTYKNIKIHLAIHTERNPLDCPKCERKFLGKDALQNHIKRVHENVPRECKILCNVCGRGIKSRAELVRHMRIHTGEKPFQCDKCEKRYRTADALSTHVRYVHLNERKHVCSVCTEAFHERRVLENHMRRHTGERPFACFICGKTFGFKVSMQIHLKQVHKVENKSNKELKNTE